MSFRFGEQVTISREGVRDEFGDRSGAASNVTVSGVGFAFESTTTSYPLADEDRSQTEALLLLPKGTDIRKGDKVTRVVDGTGWHVIGMPEWDHSVHPMTGWDSGMFTQRLRRVS